MTDELSLLINNLSRYAPFGPLERPPALNFILNYRQFVKVLIRINERIGWTDAKREVALKVKSMVVNYRRYGTPIGKEALHTLITGDPGVGKTMFGSDLAELWATSGCLNRSTEVAPLNTEKIAVRLLLSTNETQLKSLREIHQQTRTEAGKAITQLNRLRKKVRNFGPEFQEIKKTFQNISVSGSLAEIKANPNVKILPVIVPNVPFHPVEFGSSPLPGETEIKFKFGVFTRGDFIAKFQGHSTDKVRTMFKEYEGGVIMIDEAYDLVTTENDDFGREVLTEIINYMTRFPDKIIFIFSGYRKQMEKTIMVLQPGLSRRFKWKFDIPGYTPSELFQIFLSQLQRHSLTIQESDQPKMEEFLKSQPDYFKYFGGDTGRLADYIRDTIQSNLFESALDTDLTSGEYNNLFKQVSFSVLETAFERYTKNYTLDVISEPPFGMYL